MRLQGSIARVWLSGLLLLASWAWLVNPAQAHSSSNSYLTISAPGGVLTLRADIHWRDIDLIFDLDRDGDGRITWGEAQHRAGDIQAWLNRGLGLSEGGQDCSMGLPDLQASEHAEGPHLSALWSVQCPGLRDLARARLQLRYSILFAQDQLHRGLLRVDLPDFQSSAILSPERSQVPIDKGQSSALRVFGQYLIEGVWHIWIGIDHVFFLLSLLVLAPLMAAVRQPVHRWRGAPAVKPVAIDVLAVVTAFTVAHSITLGLSVMKWLEPPPQWIEPAIALSVVVAALNNLIGWSALRRWRLAFVFGLVHGFGFANVLLDLGLPASALAAALGGFNVGVEIGQLAIVLVFLPLAWLMRHTAFYRWVVVTGGSLTIAVAGMIWTLQRTGLLTL